MKIRKNGSWEQWRKTSRMHKREVYATHIIVIAGVFIAAAILQYL
ncbi:hypothetical protein [Chryseobacterium salviniae]|uniref:Uncharacterized protein n=1 Tax=Chryseobacterium salviniae TaxID=3101750 RepID=A0ABU6HN33_9FLAO|nr:hypothetical protein [Chryseobacterium sp. T9W2-O]MEC3874338.1 hypothetical protein [Chryseobacterium sp. T9W2-O]